MVILKKAQKIVEVTAVKNNNLLALKSFNMFKFVLKIYNCFIKNIEINTPVIIYFLFG
jgi:hypothetical protein